MHYQCEDSCAHYMVICVPSPPAIMLIIEPRIVIHILSTWSHFFLNTCLFDILLGTTPEQILLISRCLIKISNQIRHVYLYYIIYCFAKFLPRFSLPTSRSAIFSKPWNFIKKFGDFGIALKGERLGNSEHELFTMCKTCLIISVLSTCRPKD